MNRIVYFVLMGLIVVFFVWSKKKDAIVPEERVSIDPIVEAPDWLKYQAERHMEGFPDQIIWVPTSDVQTSSLVRVPRFPRKISEIELQANSRFYDLIPDPLSENDTLKIEVIENEIFSGQLVYLSRDNTESLTIEASDFKNQSGKTIGSESFQFRMVGYVPVERGGSELDWSAKYEEVVEPGFAVSGTMNPDVIADPLFDLDYIAVPALRNQPIWLTIYRLKVDSGTYDGLFKVAYDSNVLKIPVQIEVKDLSITDPLEYQYYSDHWLNPDAIADYYGFEKWSDAHLDMLKKYLAVQADIGSRDITAIVVEEPWRIPSRGQNMMPQSKIGYGSMVKWIKSGDDLTFDFSILNDYVKLVNDGGLTGTINLYSMTPFSGSERLSFWNADRLEIIEEEFDGLDDRQYQKYWKEFLDALWLNSEEEGWSERMVLSFDERPEEVMEKIVSFIKMEAPQYANKISIAGHPESDQFTTSMLSMSLEFFPGQNLESETTLEVINKRNHQNKMTSFYLCGQPAHPNMLTVSPAVEARMIPMIAAKYNVSGSLRWAFNNWPSDIYRNTTYNFIQGDEYLIYPGVNGPVSSIRWELLRDGIEDYELFNSSEYRSSGFKDSLLRNYTHNVDGRKVDVDVVQGFRSALINEISE